MSSFRAFDFDIWQVVISESRGAAVSAAVSLLYTGICSLGKVSNSPSSAMFSEILITLLQLLEGSFTFFEAVAEVREVFKCLGIQLGENGLSVADGNTAVKNEQYNDMLWDPLEEKSVSIDDEFTSNVPLPIDMGESPMSPTSMEKQNGVQSLLVSSAQHLCSNIILICYCVGDKQVFGEGV